MSGLIQRLLERSAPAVATTPSVQPAARSVSPVAQFDQRLQGGHFADLSGLPPMLSEADAPELLSVPATLPRPLTHSSETRRPVRSLRRDTAAPSPSPLHTTAPELPAATPVSPPLTSARPEPVTAKSAVAESHQPPPSRPDPKHDSPGPRPEMPETQSAPPSQTLAPTVSPLPAREATLAERPPTPLAKPPKRSDKDTSPSQPAQAVVNVPYPVLPERTPVLLAKETLAAPIEVRVPRDYQMAAPAAPADPAHSRLEPDSPRFDTRIVERLIREVPVSDPEPNPRRTMVTAESISKIGRLPDRRRVFTLFGQRRH